jgi:hypothetical protein
MQPTAGAVVAASGVHPRLVALFILAATLYTSCMPLMMASGDDQVHANQRTAGHQKSEPRMTTSQQEQPLQQSHKRSCHAKTILVRNAML